MNVYFKFWNREENIKLLGIYMQQEKGEEIQKTTFCKSKTGIQNPGFKRRDFNKRKK